MAPLQTDSSFLASRKQSSSLQLGANALPLHHEIIEKLQGKIGKELLNARASAERSVEAVKGNVEKLVRGLLAQRFMRGPVAHLKLGVPLIKMPMPDQQIARNGMSKYNFAAIIPGDSVAEAVFTSSVANFLNIYNALLIGRLILTWFPNPPQVIANPLSTICDPYLNLFRGIIPPLGGSLDFSPILAFLTLNVFTNAAAALPAEMPRDESALGDYSSPSAISQGKLTWRQREYLKRFGKLPRATSSATTTDIPAEN
eukprot:jgi/Mesen1/1312/ME000013S00804